MVKNHGASPDTTYVVAAVLIGLAVVLHGDAMRVADPDLFVTLYSGREIVANGWVPYVDTVTVSVMGKPWIDYEWLARVVFHAVHSLGGGPGLVIWRLVMSSTLVLLLVLHARRYSHSVLALMIGLGFLATCLHPYLMFRPRLFTFVAVAVLLTLFDRARAGRTWLVWLIPPIVVLWTNLHGGYAMGIVLIGLSVAESLAVTIYRRWGPAAAPALPLGLSTKGVLPLPLVSTLLVVSVLCTGINPYGFANWGAVFHTLGSDITPYISEWRPMADFGLARFVLVYLLMLTIIVVIGLARKRATLFDLMLCGMLLAASLLRVRFVALFTLASVFVLLRLLPVVGESVSRHYRGGLLPLARRYRPLLAPAAAALALILVVWRGVHSDLQIHKLEPLTPVRAQAFLEKNSIGGRFLNEYDWGGYVRFRMPEALIFVDGRSDSVYPAEITAAWAGFVAAAPGSETLPREFDVDVIFLRRSHRVVSILNMSSEWIRAYADEHAAIFLRDSARNARHLALLESGELTAPRVTRSDYFLD